MKKQTSSAPNPPLRGEFLGNTAVARVSDGGTNRDAAAVWLAVVEKDLSAAVSRSDNAAESLYHAAVLLPKLFLIL
jgi:Tfp pilus assembly protein PilV